MKSIDKYVGSFVSLVNGRMSLTGFLRKLDGDETYRLDIRRQEGFYIFSIADVVDVWDENSIIIVVKLENHENT